MKLATRYFIVFAAITTAAFVTYGAAHTVSEYDRSLEHASELQRGEARVVATRIAAYLEIAAHPPAGSTAVPPDAQSSLRFLRDLVAAVELPNGGRAFIAERGDPLLADLEPHGRVRDSAASRLALFSDVRANTSRGDGDAYTLIVRAAGARADALTIVAMIPGTEWRVVIEQPLQDVMAAVRASILRTLALLTLLLAGGLVASRFGAARLSRPAVELERAVAAERNVRATADEIALVNEQLRTRVNELAQSTEGLVRANAAKTRFLAAASHDLRQPMQAISLLVEVLRERVAQQEVCALVEKVHTSVQALETLFVSLLDISRLDAGAVQVHTQEFAIDSLLDLLHANFAPQAAHKGLELHVVRSRAVVKSDPVLLERILANLVSNAIRYSARGRVVVGCRRGGDRLRILVIDQGIGVPSALHDKIFDEFFQITSAEHDRSNGLGLGLSIVKRTAELLQHPLIVRSEPDRGSTFGIEVPLVAQARSTATNPRIGASHDARLAGSFVLVIDDDRQNRFAIEALCTQWGCHVVGASAPETALSSLEEHLRSPDLIITDYRLRGRDTGMRAIEMLRDKEEETIPAIVMTGDMSLQTVDLEPCSRVALLHKPINAEKLWEAAVHLVRGES